MKYLCGFCGEENCNTSCEGSKKWKELSFDFAKTNSEIDIRNLKIEELKQEVSALEERQRENIKQATKLTGM
jgi:hypothetical protein